MFDQVSQEGGFTVGDTIKKFFGIDGSTIKGSFQTGDAGVEFSTESFKIETAGGQYNVSQRTADAINRQRSWNRALTAMHEIMHLAGFNDEQLAYATATINKDENYLVRGLPPNPTTRKNITDASSYWSHRMSFACNSIR